VVLAVGPLLQWRKDSFARIRMPVVALAVLGTVVLAGVLLTSDIGILPLLGLVLSIVVMVGSFLPLRGRSLRRLPLATWGMVIAHFGVGVSLFGMATDTAFQQERLVAANVGDVVEVGPWQAVLEGVLPVAGPNWTALEASLPLTYDGKEAGEARPQARAFWSPPQETSEIALVTRWNGQLYVGIGNQTEDGRWQLRLWWKPFVTFIWYGGLLIALGGVLALLGRLLTDIRRRVAARKIADRKADEEALA